MNEMIALFSHFCQVYTESRGLTSQTEIWPIKGLWDLLELHWTEWALLFWTHSGLHFPGITSSFYTHSAAVPGHSMNGYFDNQLLLPWYKNIKFKLKVNYNKQKHIVHWFKHYTDCFLCYGHLHSGILRHYFFFCKAALVLCSSKVVSIMKRTIHLKLTFVFDNEIDSGCPQERECLPRMVRHEKWFIAFSWFSPLQ